MMMSKTDKPEFRSGVVRQRFVQVRSIGCQATPSKIPEFHKLAYVGTESQYTGVHYKENYAAVRANYRIPQIVPHLEVRPNERNLHGIKQSLPEKNNKKDHCMPKIDPKRREELFNDGNEVEEEKYAGPLLHGAIPEMIVGSGALGMTAPKKQRKRGGADEGGISAGQKFVKLFEPLEDPDWSLADSSKTSTSTSRQNRKSQVPMVDSTSESILRAIEPHLPPEVDQFDSLDIDNEALPIQEESEEEKQKRVRYREIGRLICEMNLSDFPQEKSERRAQMLAHRGDEILAAVRRNLAVIRDKLGEYAEGTIFNYVDELTDSFAEVTPNGIARLNDAVTEKLNRKEGTIADALAVISQDTSDSGIIEVKEEEVDVKLEEPDYIDNFDL